ncbi:hypothetical protein [Rhizobium calliandrae]|uniref:hypothetical protein n=1 Tax=Rhizobium calliandrae TaxID=1312182 RepID=UPI00255A13A7|nr:hypothetical protein [Rhizobium calliandrae]
MTIAPFEIATGAAIRASGLVITGLVITDRDGNGAFYRIDCAANWIRRPLVDRNQR